MRASTAIALFATGAYVWDVLAWPTLIASRAREESTRRRKPMLNVGAGTKGSSLRARILGPTLWGDVNVDIQGQGAGDDGTVGYADVHDLPYKDKTFGASIASHVIEHVEDPQAAINEMARVTDGPVFIIAPPWWAPHTWTHLGHRWLLNSDGTWARLHSVPSGVVIEPTSTGLENTLAATAALRLLSPF
jgi:SAM-dependent methyltransferase